MTQHFDHQRKTKQEQFEASMELYGHDIPAPTREPNPARLPDAKAMLRNLTAQGERRLAVALRGDHWKGPELDDEFHLAAVSLALAKRVGHHATDLMLLAGPTEIVDAALHYLWCVWLDRDHRRLRSLAVRFDPSQEIQWLRDEFGTKALLGGMYSAAVLLP